MNDYRQIDYDYASCIKVAASGTGFHTGGFDNDLNGTNFTTKEILKADDLEITAMCIIPK